MDDEDIVEALTQVKGVGRWTVHMFLIFRLGRPDVLPIEDYGVRKGFSIATGASELPSPKALAEYAERWKPYRSVASWYMWRIVDLSARAPDSKTEHANRKRPGPARKRRARGRSDADVAEF
jgi:3-methyladenine DNA glycosylase/8-oxoguanine DNA glycosylase